MNLIPTKTGKSSSLQRLRQLNFDSQGLSNLSTDVDSTVITRSRPRIFSSSSKDVNKPTKMAEANANFEWLCEHDLCRRTVFVHNVPFSMNQSELRDFFIKFGKLRYARIITEFKTKKPKGQAKLEYAKIDDVENLLTLPEREFQFSNTCMKPTLSRCLKPKNKTEPKSVENTNMDYRPVFDDELNPVSNCHFSRLPDELINYIFSFLDFRERISLESVCKRWRCVNTKMAWVDMHTLSFKNKFTKMDCKPLTKATLTAILERCGSTLREIDFSDCHHKLTPEFPIEISKYCPNLEKVNFTKTSVKKKALKILAEVCKNLKIVKLSSCGGVAEKGAWWLLKNTENLQYLDLTDNKKVTGKCFYFLKNNIQTLILNGCTLISPIGFDHLQNCHGIRDLRLDNCRSLTPENLVTVIKALEASLVTLYLGGYFENCNKHTFAEVFEHCKNLQCLHVEQNSDIVDDTVILISQKCRHLSNLNLSGIMMSDAGLQALQSLPQLRSLFVNYNTLITEDAIIKLSQPGILEHVELRGSCSVGDIGCVKLIETCSNLKLLDISSCINITNVTVDAAILLGRSDKNKLTIIAGGSSVSNFGKKGNVDVMMLNLCPSQYQPFFQEYVYDFDDDDDDVDDDDDDGEFGYDFDDCSDIDDFDDYMYEGDVYLPF